MLGQGTNHFTNLHITVRQLNFMFTRRLLFHTLMSTHTNIRCVRLRVVCTCMCTSTYTCTYSVNLCIVLNNNFMIMYTTKRQQFYHHYDYRKDFVAKNNAYTDEYTGDTYD